MSDGSYMRDHMLAMDIIKAIAMFDWPFMCDQFPDGVKYKGTHYHKPEHFTQWNDHKIKGRYVDPARDAMVNLCANKAWTLLNNLYG